MSWLFSQALVAAYSAARCLDGAPCAQLSVMPTPQQFWRNDKMMDVSRLSQFGLTCAVLTDDLGAELLMWYRVDFLVKIYPLQAKEQASTAHAQGFGEKWHELSVKYDPDMCMWKTHQCLWDEDLPESSVTLPKWGMTRNGALYQHQMLERPISVTDFGYSQQIPNNVDFWHTPTTCELDGGSNSRRALKKRLIPTPTVCGNNNRKGLSAKSGDGLATFVRQYPTPKAQDSRHALTDRGKCNLGEVIGGETDGGRLNPTWVEWLMGWPLGWTDLKPLLMDKFRSWQRSHGGF